jgi:hypothetical protein
MSAYSFNTEFKAFFMLSRVDVSLLFVSLFGCHVNFGFRKKKRSEGKGKKNCQKSVLGRRRTRAKERNLCLPGPQVMITTKGTKEVALGSSCVSNKSAPRRTEKKF